MTTKSGPKTHSLNWIWIRRSYGRKIYEAVKEPLENENITLVGVHFGKEDGEDTLFVTIENSNGEPVDTDLCVKATKIVDPIIDSLDLDLENYVLDVGSKGEENE